MEIVSQSGLPLELVLWTEDRLVLYDPERRALIARHVGSGGGLVGAELLSPRGLHSNELVANQIRCPLCSQTVHGGRDFITERYFQLLEEVNRRGGWVRTEQAGSQRVSSDVLLTAQRFDIRTNPFSRDGVEAAELGASLMNAGYYDRFFNEKQLLGKGSFGSVFLCSHVIDDIPLGEFAVKKIPVGQSRDWFRTVVREVKALERLATHPNIVAYKHSWLDMHRSSEFCPYTPFLFILMTYCDRGSLEDRIKGGTEEDLDRRSSRKSRSLGAPPLSESEIWSILLDVLHGMHHIHRVGVLSRDTKTSNILLISDSEKSCGVRAVLSDFGTAELMGELSGKSHSGFTATVEFTAPEVLAEPNHAYSEYSDMWSVGIVLYCMLYGHVPYYDVDPQLCARKVMAHDSLPFPSHSEVSSELMDLLIALTAKNWQNRPLCNDLLAHPIIRERERSSL